MSGLRTVNFILEDEAYEQLKTKKQASKLSWPQFILKIARIKTN